MFGRILKKDLNRKKTMNVILLLFVIMSSMFLASSISNMITISHAMDQYLKLANIPDLVIPVMGNTPVWKFLSENPEVEDYEILPTIYLSKENLSILTRQDKNTAGEYVNMTTIALCTDNSRYIRGFSLDGKPLQLEDGEIGIVKSEAEKNHLQTGDLLRLEINGVSKEFKIAVIVKDAAFGSNMMGVKRFFINQKEFGRFYQNSGERTGKIYCINVKDESAFQKDMRKLNLSAVGVIDQVTIKLSYMMDMVISGILIVVSICLILIAFFILRFTIIFTLQEDFQEIGIMKAIGISDFCIKRLYLLKYILLAVAGASVGLGLSYPFGGMLMKQALSNLVVEKVSVNSWIPIACAGFVVIIVLLFCYLSTGKLRKFSAIEAIRGGLDGESYHSKSSFRLSRQKKFPAVLYLAVNDILKNKRRFLMLCLIFCIGSLLIFLPLSAIHTLKSKDSIRLYSMLPSDVFLDNGNLESYVLDGGQEQITETIAELHKRLETHDIPAEIWVELVYQINYYTSDPEELFNCYGRQVLNHTDASYDILEGSIPKYENEILITEIMAKESGLGIGDTIQVICASGKQTFLITGIFQSMMNMGREIRFSTHADLRDFNLAGIFNFQLDLPEQKGGDYIALLEEVLPEYKILTSSPMTDILSNGVIQQLDSLKILIVLLVAAIHSLITILMIKMMAAREQGEIALMKSIGFSDRILRYQQSLRIFIILALSVFLGIGLSRLLAPVTIGKLFAVAGITKVRLVINPWETFLWYPMLLLLITGGSAWLCSGVVKKVDVKEINSLA